MFVNLNYTSTIMELENVIVESIKFYEAAPALFNLKNIYIQMSNI